MEVLWLLIAVPVAVFIGGLTVLLPIWALLRIFNYLDTTLSQKTCSRRRN